MSPKYLTTTAAAKVLGMSRWGIRLRIARGELPAIKLGRDYGILLTDLKKPRAAPGRRRVRRP